jgi:hypothetical protein
MSIALSRLFSIAGAKQNGETELTMTAGVRSNGR